MPRLFAAIRPPAAVRSSLLECMGGIAGARWQDDDQLHITLRFVGEVDHRLGHDLADALADIRFAPFTVTLSGLGCFARKGQVNTLWAGVEPRDPLTSLHQKIDRACVRSGLPPETRSYHPHIALARFGRTAGPMHDFLSRHAALASAPFTVDQFTLYESLLAPSGSTYHTIQRYPAKPDQRD